MPSTQRSIIHVRGRLASLLVYGIANAQPQLTAAVLAILYTRVFSLHDFGVYGVLSSVLFVVGIFVEMGAGSAILRNYYDLSQDEAAARAYLRSVAQGARVVSLAVLPFLAAALYFGWGLLGIGPEQRGLFVALIVLVSFFDRSCEVFGAICRATERPADFAIGRALQGIVTIGAGFILVVELKTGLAGAMAANLAGRFVGAIALEAMLFRRLDMGRLHFRLRDVKACLAFGLPLVPNRTLGWARFIALRPILANFVSMPQVGLFSLASAISSLPNLLSGAVDLALSPVYFSRRATGVVEFPEKARRFAIVFATILFPVWVTLITFAPMTIRILAGPRFEGAVPVFTILFCAAYIRSQMQFLFRQVQFLKKTWIMPLVTLPSTIASIGLTILWVADYGIMAAAFAVLVSDTVLFLLLAWVVRRYERLVVPVPTTLFLQSILLLLAFWVIMGEPVPAGMHKLLVQALIVTMASIATVRIWLWREREFIFNLIFR